MTTPARDTTTGAPLLLLVLLFASGFTSLVYEVTWSRILVSVFGATVYASGTILTSFMAGLGIGGYAGSRLIKRWTRSPILLYGLLELGIGLYALVLPGILEAIKGVHVVVYQQFGGSFTMFSLLRFVLCFLALITPAAMMGATLPIITEHAVPRLKSLARDLSGIYSINTIGAALGTLVTGFVFIEFLGIRLTTWLTAALNVLIFLGALALAKRLGPAPVVEAEEPEVASDRPRLTPAQRTVLLVVLISGCCALAYEVLWARIMVYVLGNFVHSFSVMLTAFLTGIAAGSWWMGRRADRGNPPWRTVAVLQLVIAVSGVLILFVFNAMIGWREAVLQDLAVKTTIAEYEDPWLSFTVWKVGITLAIMFIPCFCMGATFPLANRLFTLRERDISRGVGSLYASNTLGGILGAFVASFVLIPLVGVRQAALVFVALNLVATVLLWTRSAAGQERRRLVQGVAGALVLVVAAWFVVPKDVFHAIYASSEKGKDLLYVDETVSGTVTIHEGASGHRVININGLNVAGTKFGFLCTQKLQAHFPMLMHPDPKNVMQVGFGTGGTCYSVSLHPEVEAIDCVEINPGVIKAAPHFLKSNQGVLEDPKVKVVIDDARHFMARTDRKYDVILSDSIHPRFTGNGMLYSLEYYKASAEVMKPGAIHSTWMPTAFLHTEHYRTILRTMREVFPHMLVWYMNNTIEGYAVVMSSREPFAVDLDELARRVGAEPVRGDLEQVHIGNAYDLLDCILIGDETVGSYLGDGPLNTEDRPVIEFGAPRAMNRIATEYQNLKLMLQARKFPATIISRWGDDPAQARERQQVMVRYIRATTRVLSAHQHHLFRQYDKERELYLEAMEINPDDRDAPFLLDRLRTISSGGQPD